MEVKKLSQSDLIVTLDTVKNYIRTNYDIDDALLDEILIRSAQDFIERTLEITLSLTQMAVYYECWKERIELPYGPHISVDEVYQVVRGEETEIENWYVQGLDFKTLFIPPTYASGETYQRGIKVVMTCGYTDPDDSNPRELPSPLLEGMLKVIATNYEYRLNVGEHAIFMPNDAMNLMKPYKRYHW